MISWVHKYYNNLLRDELYEILRLRQEVFIIEQNCNYLDADNYDKQSLHLMGYKKNQLIAYMRILPEKVLYLNTSFGRILVKKEYRDLGIGKELLKRGIDLCSPNKTIVMSAQLYLIKFYQIFGFKSVGEEYLEDEIPHIKMIRNGKDKS